MYCRFPVHKPNNVPDFFFRIFVCCSITYTAYMTAQMFLLNIRLKEVTPFDLKAGPCTNRHTQTHNIVTCAFKYTFGKHTFNI